MIPHPDEIGQFQTQPQVRALFQRRDQQTCRARHGRVRQTQAGQPQNRKVQNAQLGIFEIELFFLLVMDGSFRADLPDRRGRVVTNTTGRCCDLVQLRVAPAGPVQLVRGQLDALVHDHPCTAQQAVFQCAVQLAGTGKDHGLVPVRHGDGAGDNQFFARTVIFDPVRLQPDVLVQHLYMAVGNQPVPSVQCHAIRDQNCRAVLCCGRGHKQNKGSNKRDYGRQETGHPSSICNRMPSARKTDAMGGAQAASMTGN